MLPFTMFRHKVGGVSAIGSQSVKYGRALRISNLSPSFYK